MRSGTTFLVSCLIIGLVLCNSIQCIADNKAAIAQEAIEHEYCVSLNNATIEPDLLGVCLKVEYTWYGGLPKSEQLNNIIGLLLSLDNLSWIDVKQHTIDESERHTNVTKVFKICNSLLEPFPFDVERGEILYITIACEYISWNGSPEFNPNIRLFPVAVMAPMDIIRVWYFTIDWTVPSIFGSIFLCLFTVFLISRHHRMLMEKKATQT